MLFLRHLGIGGIESFLNNVYTNLDLSDFIVDIVAANQFESVFTEPLKKLGIHFYELSGRQNNFKENVKAFESILKKETMMQCILIFKVLLNAQNEDWLKQLEVYT